MFDQPPLDPNLFRGLKALKSRSGRHFGAAWPIDDVMNVLKANAALPISSLKRASGLVALGNMALVNSVKMRTFIEKHDGALRCANPDCCLEAQFAVLEHTRGADENSWYFSFYGKDANNQWVEFTHDHVVARAFGGENATENTVPMCHPCNAQKSLLESVLCQSKETAARILEVTRVLQAHIHRMTGQVCQPQVLWSRRDDQEELLAYGASLLPVDFDDLKDNTAEQLKHIQGRADQRRTERIAIMVGGQAQAHGMEPAEYLAWCEIKGAEVAAQIGSASGSAPYRKKAKEFGLTPNGLRFFNHEHHRLFFEANPEIRDKMADKLAKKTLNDAEPSGEPTITASMKKRAQKNRQRRRQRMQMVAARMNIELDVYIERCEDIGARFKKAHGNPEVSREFAAKAESMKMSVAGYWVARQYEKDRDIDAELRSAEPKPACMTP